jgi:hypothetical protein
MRFLLHERIFSKNPRPIDNPAISPLRELSAFLEKAAGKFLDVRETSPIIRLKHQDIKGRGPLGQDRAKASLKLTADPVPVEANTPLVLPLQPL